MSLTGDRIKECRLRCKLTQADVASHLGIGKQAVYKYETGAVTNIPLDKVIAMANLFGTTPEYLAGWSDTEDDSENETQEKNWKLDLQLFGKEEEDDIRLLIRGLHKLSPEQIAQAKAVFKAMFAATNPDLFDEGDDDHGT